MQDNLITVGDKIRSLITIEDGNTTSNFTNEEKQASVSKSNILDQEYTQVSESSGYDDSEKALEALKQKFQAASENQGPDPIIQNGFTERIKIDEDMIDVGLIKATNAVCNNVTKGSYQTIHFSFKLNQINPDEVETLEAQWDLDLSGKKIDINRPGKTTLIDNHVTCYLNKMDLKISVTFPLTGNDQILFDDEFQDYVVDLVSYGLSQTLKKLIENKVENKSIAAEEVKLTSRKSIEDIIRKFAKARYAQSSEEEIEEIVSNVYPAVSAKLEIKPLTGKSITISLVSNLVEKALKEECEWSSTSDKWNYFATDTHIMRYRPISSASHTFPVVEDILDDISDKGYCLFKKFINTCNNMLTNKLGLSSITKTIDTMSIPDHDKTLSKALGMAPTELYAIKKDVKEQIIKVVEETLKIRDDNTKTSTMASMSQ